MWSLRTQEGRNLELFEMMCLRNMCGIRRGDGVRKVRCELSVLECVEMAWACGKNWGRIIGRG